MAASARDDITAVWELEPPTRADAPVDRDDPQSPSEPGAGKVQEVRGEPVVDVVLDRGEAPPSVPTLPPPEAVVPTPVTMTKSEPVPVGSAREPRSRSAFALVAALWLMVGGGLLWMVWPGDAKREAKSEVVVAEPAMSAEDAKPEVQPEHAGPTTPVDPDAKPNPEPVIPTPEPEPPPSVEPVMPTPEPEPPPSAEPVVPTPEPEPPPRAEPVVPTTKPTPSVEPTPVAQPAEPTSKPSKPKPARKTKPEPLPPVRVKIALIVTAPMDIEIAGVHRSLDSRMTKATLAVTPGRVRVRWRRPTGEWRSRTVVIEPGVDYQVWLEPSGPTFEAVKKKP